MSDHTASDQSPDALERDAERVRAQIADTAEHLKDKMSPGQLMDEVVDYFKDGDTNQLLQNLKVQIRDNPLALAVVGGGLAWLMMGSGPSTPTARRPPSSTAVHPRSGAGAPGVARPGSPAQSHLTSATKGVEAARDKAASVAAGIGDAASSASDTVSATAHDMRDAAGDYMASVSHAGAEAGSRIRSTFLDALEREPLVLGALGVAVGAAIGAMLPATRVEQEHLGEVSQKARHGAEAAISEGLDKARHVAGDVYAAARSEADRQGLTPGDRPLVEKAGEVVGSAGDELKRATDDLLHQAEGTEDRPRDRVPPGSRPM